MIEDNILIFIKVWALSSAQKQTFRISLFLFNPPAQKAQGWI